MRFLDTTDTKFMKIRFQTFKKRSDALKSRSRIKNNFKNKNHAVQYNQSINQSMGNSSPLRKNNGVNPPSPHGANTASAVVNKPCATTPSTLSISAWI